MSLDFFLPLTVFAGVLVCTPGPANLLLMASGARFGFLPSLPLVCGVTLGKIFIHATLAAGLWKIIGAFPGLLTAMKIIGAAYILWLAKKMLSLRMATKKSARPLSFVAGLAVHPLNPKAWAMVVAAYGQFIDAHNSWWTQTIIIGAVFFFWQCVAHNFWCWGGAVVAQKISGTATEIYLMRLLAALMVAAVAWSLFR